MRTDTLVHTTHIGKFEMDIYSRYVCTNFWCWIHPGITTARQNKGINMVDATHSNSEYRVGRCVRSDNNLVIRLWGKFPTESFINHPAHHGIYHCACNLHPQQIECVVGIMHLVGHLEPIHSLRQRLRIIWLTLLYRTDTLCTSKPQTYPTCTLRFWVAKLYDDHLVCACIFYQYGTWLLSSQVSHIKAMFAFLWWAAVLERVVRVSS